MEHPLTSKLVVRRQIGPVCDSEGPTRDDMAKQDLGDVECPEGPENDSENGEKE